MKMAVMSAISICNGINQYPENDWRGNGGQLKLSSYWHGVFIGGESRLMA
jgi:hypothetical protein